MTRTFKAKPATREEVPLLVGLTGASGSGKTYSALRIASGIQRVSGGDIYVIDTEAKRSLHYADKFKFKHLAFDPPHGPADYMAAIEHCVKDGAKIVIVDSMSHEHEGQGGILEMHEAELQRMGGRASDNFRAWAKPKAERRVLINRILQLPIHFIGCFRAKEKTKPGADRKLVDLGWMPIAGEEFVFEMTAQCLLMPGCNGVPEWNPQRDGERKMTKCAEQFETILKPGRVLSEEVGEEMARWAQGEPSPVDKGALLKKVKAELKRHGKTKDGMAETALQVFNAESWDAVTALDVAALEKGLGHLESSNS